VRAGHGVEQPAQLGRREVRVDQQPGVLAHPLDQPRLRAQVRAQRLGAAVLPDDRAGQRPAAAAAPQHGGLALVGDADGADVARAQARAGDGLARGVELGGPDLLGVVLDPAGLRVVLAQLALREGDDAALGVEDDAARTRGALVQGQQMAHR